MQSRADVLAGVIFTITDNILVHSERTTGGSRIPPNFISAFDAMVIPRSENGDAVVVTKTTRDDAAHYRSGKMK